MNKSKIEQPNRFLEFQLGDEFYAVELLKVREVITPPELTPIPKSSPHVCGLMNLRGLVLTVVDLRKRLGIKPLDDQAESAVIIFDLGDRLVGAKVDIIHRVINVQPEAFRPVPDVENQQLTQNLHGIIQLQSKLIFWLDVNKLLGGLPQHSLKAA
jgi:purine-binding chemotaxis protein CheW